MAELSQHNELVDQPLQLEPKELRQEFHDQLSLILGYDCGKNTPEYVVQMIKNGKTVAQVHKGLADLIGDQDAKIFSEWVTPYMLDAIEGLTAEDGGGDDDVEKEMALQMKIRHLEAELRKKNTDIKDLKVALKDSLYENVNAARSITEITTNAKVQVQKHIKHVKAVTDLHTQDYMITTTQRLNIIEFKKSQTRLTRFQSKLYKGEI